MLDTLSNSGIKHTVIYSGTQPSYHQRRDLEEGIRAPGNATAPAGVFHEYQLFTSGLILSLLITFFVLIPAVFLGATALSSIQSPLKTDGSRTFNAQDKKTQ